VSCILTAICNITEDSPGVLCLVALTHNLEINWKTGKVKITRYPPLYGGKSQKKEKVKRVATKKEKKIIRWTIYDKEDWGKEEEMEEDHRKIEEMVPKKFLK